MAHDPERAEHGEVLTGPGGPERRGAVRRAWGPRSARTRSVTAAATVAVLALGGTVAFAATSSGSGETAASASDTASPKPGGPGERHGYGMGFGLRAGGIHGEATVKDRESGRWVVRTWQRGTVQEAGGDRVTVRSEDGTTWTWTVGEDTAVRRDGGKVSGADGLRKGEKAVVVGTRSGDGTRTASRVLAGTREAGGKDRGRGEGRDGLRGPRHGDGRDARSPDGPAGSGSAT